MKQCDVPKLPKRANSVHIDTPKSERSQKLIEELEKMAGKPYCRLTQEEIEKLKKERRMTRNRESARRSREKRKAEIQNLTNRVTNLQQENEHLKRLLQDNINIDPQPQIQKLTMEMKRLKDCIHRFENGTPYLWGYLHDRIPKLPDLSALDALPPINISRPSNPSTTMPTQLMKPPPLPTRLEPPANNFHSTIATVNKNQKEFARATINSLEQTDKNMIPLAPIAPTIVPITQLLTPIPIAPPPPPPSSMDVDSEATCSSTITSESKNEMMSPPHVASNPLVQLTPILGAIPSTSIPISNYYLVPQLQSNGNTFFVPVMCSPNSSTVVNSSGFQMQNESQPTSNESK